MTWTYAGAPGSGTAAEKRDAVRFFVGDTDSTDEQITDEEIAYLIGQAPNLKTAAAQAARSIAAKYARLVDNSVESIRNSYSQRQTHYLALATRLEKEADDEGDQLGEPSVSGISVSEMDSVEDDSDRVKPAFRRGMFDNQGTPPEDPDW